MLGWPALESLSTIMQNEIENHIISSQAFATGNFMNALKFKEAAEVAIWSVPLLMHCINSSGTETHSAL